MISTINSLSFVLGKNVNGFHVFFLFVFLHFYCEELIKFRATWLKNFHMKNKIQFFISSTGMVITNLKQIFVLLNYIFVLLSFLAKTINFTLCLMLYFRSHFILCVLIILFLFQNKLSLWNIS